MLYESSLVAPLDQLARKEPDFVVLENEHLALTAGELITKSKNLACALAHKGFTKGDIAVIAAQPGEEFLQIMFALLMLHGKIAIIDPEMGSANYAAKIKQLQARWIFADSRLLLLREHPVLRWIVLRQKKNLPDLRSLKGMMVISVGPKMPLFRSHINFSNLTKKAFPEQTFTRQSSDYENLIVYTSGTLNMPKGVVHTDRNLNNSILALKNILAAEKEDVVGTYLPHFMLLGISAGITVKVMKQHLSPEKKIEWMETEKINIFFGPPSEFIALIQYCEKNKRSLPGSLKHLLLGSAPVHRSFLNRLVQYLPQHTKITCTYGMTEHLLVSVMDGREKIAYAGDGDVLGRPVAGVEVKISSDNEILVRSNQLFKRYFHEKERTAWHATGDIGKLDSEGNIVLMGRSKEMIIRRNFNIYPALYEDTIKKIKGIEEAALVGIYDEELQDEKVYLAIESQMNNAAEVNKLLTYGKYSIDKEALPDTVVQMTIPRKGRQNKIDREAIRAFIQKHQL